MGTIPIDAKTMIIRNKESQIEAWTNTSDLAAGDDGFATVCWALEEISYCANIPFWIFSVSYLSRFYRAIQTDADFLNRFKITASTREKKFQKVEINGVIVLIDAEIFLPIKLLNKYGFITTYCCRGNYFDDEDHSECAYLEAESLPENLLEVAYRAGFYATTHLIRAEFSPEFQKSANEKFGKLLIDWSINNLSDPENYHPEKDLDYRSRVRRKFKIPEAVTGQISAQQLKKFLNIKKPKFKDFAELRSWRDGYSNMTLEMLINQAGELCMKEVKKDLDTDTEIASSLRWVLRGLPIDYAIRKVKIDMEIRTNRLKKG